MDTYLPDMDRPLHLVVAVLWENGDELTGAMQFPCDLCERALRLTRRGAREFGPDHDTIVLCARCALARYPDVPDEYGRTVDHLVSRGQLQLEKFEKDNAPEGRESNPAGRTGLADGPE